MNPTGKFLTSTLLVFSTGLVLPVHLHGQSVIREGKGSYAAYTPLSEAEGTLTQPVNQWGVRSGDQTQKMRTRRLYVNEKYLQDGHDPIPTNDWWTDMLFENYGGNLWSYPQKFKADKDGKGLDFEWPSFWMDNGTEVKSRTRFILGGEMFKPKEAIVEGWHDWDMEFSLTDGERQMMVTTAHGVPFTFVETKGLNPTIQLSDNASYQGGTVTAKVLDKNGNNFVSGSTTDQLIVALSWSNGGQTGTDLYALFFPANTMVTVDKNMATLNFDEREGYVSVAMLKQVDDMAVLAPYAYNVPRYTEVSWQYEEAQAKMKTTWSITAENLKTGQQGVDVMQGFIPHQYRGGADNSAAWNGIEYMTPHGQVKMATGKSFDISYNFYGMLPYYALPTDTEAFDITLDARHAESGADTKTTTKFDPEIMKTLLNNYANEGSFGGDTYWGGKGLTQMALYMMIAREMGETEIFEKCRTKLKNAFVNWLTYTPGEPQYFFSMEPRYGGMIGSDTSYGSDEYNDHHFHYGYFTYAAGLLALVDDDFRENYGPMMKLIAKDYANWDRTDKRSCFLRTFDPWAGHSFAGGKGDGNGNGQESSSEAMQSWGGLYLLGQALGDKEMRDAGLFGWISEARAVAEYWFDRYREDTTAPFDRSDTSNFNIDYTKFSDDRGVHPYNSNLTCHGVGWWNYFSGDQFWNAAIQWMPISPMLDYLSEDVEFAKWDFNTAWDIKTIGGWYAHNFNSDGYDDGSLGDGSGLGNVALSYLQRFAPDQSAGVFDALWNKKLSTATATDTGGLTYFITHNHLSYGELTWDVQPSDPMARAYVKDGNYTFMAYNSGTTDKTITFRKDGVVVGTLVAKPRQLTVSNQAYEAVNDNITAVDNSEADPREELVMPNLALGKKVTESGHENVGTVPQNAIDGDLSTRWGSLHKDNEWLQVDLGKTASLYKINIHWEAAYASEYKIMTSVDGDSWDELTEVGASNQWVATMMNDAKARYIRIVGTKRSTTYGISIHELEAYGQWDDADPTDLLGVKIDADQDFFKQYEAGKVSVKGYTVGKQWTDVSATWSSTDGDISADGTFAPATVGTATVTATIGDLKASKAFAVEEANAIDQIILSPKTAELIVDDEQQYAVSGVDQFKAEAKVSGVNYSVRAVTTGDTDASTTYAETTNATVSKEGLFTASAPGDYAVIASVLRAGTTDEYIADTAYVAAKYITEVNLALGKNSYSSSDKDGNTSAKAFDGNGTNSRWESQHGSEDEHLTVDLGDLFMVNKVRFLWEGAYAARYELQVSEDNKTFHTLREVTLNKAGEDVQSLATPVKARYVRMHGLKRALNYGYSIYEMEVYGTEKVATTISVTIKDGFNTIGADDTSSDTYNLQGVKVKATQRGVYIRNGRKMIVKEGVSK